MEMIKNILAGMCIVLPILLVGYGLIAWIGPNGMILCIIGLCILWVCGAIGIPLRKRWKATS